MAKDLQQVQFVMQKCQDHLAFYKKGNNGFFGPNRGYIKGIENCIDFMEKVIERGGIESYDSIRARNSL